MPYQSEPAIQGLKQRLLPTFFVWLLAVVVLVVQWRSTWLEPLQSSFFSYVYQPVSAVVHAPIRRFVSVSQRWQDEREDLAQLDKLAEENRALKAQLQQFGHLRAENRRLRMLMDSSLTVTEPVLIAELVDTAIDGYSETVLINKGMRHGVYLQQPIIDPFGLVGQVVAVYEQTARVMLISDARSRVPSYVERTSQRVTVLGSAERGELVLPWQRYESDIEVGDRLISSGLGGVFPRGYPVAEVVAIEQDKDSSFLQVVLKPIAHLPSMLEVLLLDTRVSEATLGEGVMVGPPAPSDLIEE